MHMKITEGYMPFLNYQTYYRIVGDITKPALVLLHGGPGSTHNYFELLDSLACDDYCLVMYDQLGCGNSYVEGHHELWTPETWVNELIALRKHLNLTKVHLLGQSWGGMLALDYVLHYNPTGIESLILSSTLSSASLWASEQHRMIRFMSESDQRAIEIAENTGNYESEDYITANTHFMHAHCAGVYEVGKAPDCLTRPKKIGKEAYLYGWGPNEYTPTGSLAGFEVTDELKHINIPTLIISGTNDLCTPLVAKTMHDNIKHSTWQLFPNCRHMVFAEETEQYIQLLQTWLKQNESVSR